MTMVKQLNYLVEHICSHAFISELKLFKMCCWKIKRGKKSYLFQTTCLQIKEEVVTNDQNQKHKFISGSLGLTK